MLDDPLSRLFSNQWMVQLITSSLLLAFAETGYRFGRRFRLLHPDDIDRPQRGLIGVSRRPLGELIESMQP